MRPLFKNACVSVRASASVRSCVRACVRAKIFRSDAVQGFSLHVGPMRPLAGCRERGALWSRRLSEVSSAAVQCVRESHARKARFTDQRQPCRRQTRARPP